MKPHLTPPYKIHPRVDSGAFAHPFGSPAGGHFTAPWALRSAAKHSKLPFSWMRGTGFI